MAHNGSNDEARNQDSDKPQSPKSPANVVTTTDPEVVATAEGPEEWKSNPDATMAVETSDIKRP
jgi:hypothetical protein